jgi:citrate synthase
MMKTVVLLMIAAIAALLIVSLRGPRLAPEGTMFMVERGTIQTENGIRGFPAGSKVQVVAEEGDFIQVSADGIEFQVPRQKLTREIDLAEALAAADRTAQREAARMVQEQRAALQAHYQEQARVQEQRQRELAMRRAASAPTASGALNRSSYNEKTSVSRRPSVAYYWVADATSSRPTATPPVFR